MNNMPVGSRPGRQGITAIILCLNEERHLSELIPLLRSLGIAVLVVDSGSVDRSVEISERAGATVLTNPWVNYSTQFNWGLSRVGPDVEWVLRIDADERPSRLMQTFLRELGERPADCTGPTGYSFVLGIWFMGRRLRYGGVSRIRQLRLFRSGYGDCESLNMDEHIRLSAGVVENRGEILDHYAVESYADWVKKHIGYAVREARDVIECFEPLGIRGTLPKEHPAYWRRKLKSEVYYRLPLFVRAYLLWFLRYILLLGFLDGLPGFLYHFFQCLWYRLLVDVLVLERRELGGVHSGNVDGVVD